MFHVSKITKSICLANSYRVIESLRMRTKRFNFQMTAACSGSRHGQGNDEDVGEEVGEEEEAVNLESVRLL